MLINDILAQKIGKVAIYKKNEVIFFENDPCENIGILLEGEIHIKKILMNGNELFFKKLRERDTFGEYLIFSRFPFYPAHILSISGSTKILFVSKKELEDFLKKDFSNMKNYINLLSDYGVNLNGKLQLLSKKTIRERLCYYIYIQTHNLSENKLRINTLEELSQMINCDRVSLSREFNKLIKEGALSHQGKYILLLNPAILINSLNEH